MGGELCGRGVGGGGGVGGSGAGGCWGGGRGGLWSVVAGVVGVGGGYGGREVVIVVVDRSRYNSITTWVEGVG